MHVIATTATPADTAGGPSAADATGFDELFAALLGGEVADDAQGAVDAEEEVEDHLGAATASSSLMIRSVPPPAPQDEHTEVRAEVAGEGSAAALDVPEAPDADDAAGGAAPRTTADEAAAPPTIPGEVPVLPAPVAAPTSSAGAPDLTALDPPGEGAATAADGSAAGPTEGQDAAAAAAPAPGIAEGAPDPSERGRPQPSVAPTATPSDDPVGEATGAPVEGAVPPRRSGADGQEVQPGSPTTSGAPAEATAVELQGAAEPPAPEAAVDARAAELARRVAQAVEQLEHRPPPRRMVVELDGLRLAVALRGDEVRIAVLGGAPSGAGEWGEDLRRALDAHGFSFDDRGGREQRSGERDDGDRPPRGVPTPGRIHHHPTRRADDGVRL